MKTNRLKNIFLLTATFTLVFGLFTSPLLARDPAPVDPNTGQPVKYFTNVFMPAINSDDVNLQSTVYEIFLSLLSSMHRSMYQCDANCLNQIGTPAFGAKTSEEQLAHQPTGFIPWLAKANAGILSSPAVSSVDYLAHVGRKLNVVSPAYAQAGAAGFGYEGLAPVRDIWTAFRNIAYLLATIGFVILSFLIMFRIKISAQTAIGAQQAIFKLITVFLAVTFSYAIAGLIIDLIFLLTFVIITMFTSTGLITAQPGLVQAQLLKGNIFQQMGAMMGAIGQGGEILTELSQQLFGTVSSGVTGVEGFINNLLNLFGGSIDLIGAVIVGIAIIYALIRLLFALLMSYLEIIILTILSPIMLLPDILPGGGAFMGWVKRLFANAMVFPTATFMLLLGIAMVGDTESGITSGVSVTFDEGLRLPFLSGFEPDTLRAFLGIGMILLTYKVVDMVKTALKVQSFPYSTAIGTALGYGAGRVAPMVAAPFQPQETTKKALGALEKVPFMGSKISQWRQEAKIRQSAYEKKEIQDKVTKASSGRVDRNWWDPFVSN